MSCNHVTPGVQQFSPGWGVGWGINWVMLARIVKARHTGLTGTFGSLGLLVSACPQLETGLALPDNTERWRALVCMTADSLVYIQSNQETTVMTVVFEIERAQDN